MLEQEDEFKFHFKKGRRTMILSILSSPALVSGLMVVHAKNPVHSISFPIPVFRNTSGLLILLGLDFSTMISPVVHIGAIAVSFLFMVMMFNIQIAEIHEEVLRYLPVSGIIGLILWWEMFFILDNETIPLLPTHRNMTSLRYTVHVRKVRSWTNLETLGNLLYTYYSIWFLLPSLILLVAMIGAIVLTMYRTTKVKREDVFQRNALDSRRTIMRRTTDRPQFEIRGSCGSNPHRGEQSAVFFAGAHNWSINERSGSTNPWLLLSSPVVGWHLSQSQGTGYYLRDSISFTTFSRMV